MAKNSGQKGKIEYRRKLIAILYHEGIRQQYDIRDALTERYNIIVDRSTISRDLKALQKEWLAQRAIDYADGQAEILAETLNLQRTYFEAWQRSTQKKEVETSKVVESGDGEDKTSRAEAQTRSEPQAGDPRFLQGIQWCIERRCKLLGLDEPKKFNLNDGQPIPVIILDNGNDNPA